MHCWTRMCFAALLLTITDWRATPRDDFSASMQHAVVCKHARQDLHIPSVYLHAWYLYTASQTDHNDHPYTFTLPVYAQSPPYAVRHIGEKAHT